LSDFLNAIGSLNSPKEKADNPQMKAFLDKHVWAVYRDRLPCVRRFRSCMVRMKNFENYYYLM